MNEVNNGVQFTTSQALLSILMTENKSGQRGDAPAPILLPSSSRPAGQ
jgi:hypothetical protein